MAITLFLASTGPESCSTVFGSLREPRSATMSDAERGLDFVRVKADDHGSIDYGNRGCHVSNPP